jgi:hypothetical protein
MILRSRVTVQSHVALREIKKPKRLLAKDKMPPHNGRAHFINVNNCLNTTIYSYLETSGGQSCNLCLNVLHFFNTSGY